MRRAVRGASDRWPAVGRWVVVGLAASLGPAAVEAASEAAGRVVVEWSDPAAHTQLASLRPTSDGFIAVLTRSAPDFSRTWLLRSSCAGEACSTPVPFELPGVRAASGAVTLAGGAVVFTSPDPTGQQVAPDAWNLWLAEEGAAAARALPFPVSSPFAECCAVAAGDGFLFASDRAGTWDVYEARREGGGFAVARLAGRVNSEPSRHGEPGYFGEWPSFVDPGGRFLLLSSIRPGGSGGDDVYIACALPAGGWGEPRNLGAPVNTGGYEDAAMVDPGGRTLFWSSRGEGETSRVLRVPFDAGAWCG
jgi:hypothetical protein